MRGGNILRSQHLISINVFHKVSIKDGISRYTLRECGGKQAFFKENFFTAAFYVNKCLKQMELPAALLTCASCFKLPSNIMTINVLPDAFIYIQGKYSTRVLILTIGIPEFWILVEINRIRIRPTRKNSIN